MITISHLKRARYSSKRGFTLVELLVAVFISVLFLAVILNVFFMMTRSAVSIGNYSDMSQQSRRVLELFSRDARAANSVTVTNKTTEVLDSVSYVVSYNGVKFIYPSFYQSGGTPTEVTYTYDSVADTLTRTQLYGGVTTSELLLRDVETFKLSFYQIPNSIEDAGTFTLSNLTAVGPLGSVDTWAKSIQLDAELKRTVVSSNSINNTDYIISARFMLRNTSN